MLEDLEQPRELTDCFSTQAGHAFSLVGENTEQQVLTS